MSDTRWPDNVPAPKLRDCLTAVVAMLAVVALLVVVALRWLW